MKNQIKKILALTLAVIMCMGIMSGCVVEEEDSEIIKATLPVTQTSSKNTEIYPLDSDKTFTIACGGTDDVGARDCFDRWNEVTGVETEVITYAGDALKLSITTGDYGDAVFYAGALSKDKWNQLGMEGRFVNFLDYIEYMPNFARALNTYPEALDVVAAPDGGIYSLPRIGTTSTTHGAIYVRTDYLKKAGWDRVPETIDELMQCMFDLKTAFADKEEFYPATGHQATYMGWNSYSSWLGFLFPSFGELLAPGYLVNEETGKVEFGANTEQYKRLLSYMNEMMKKNYMEFGPDIYQEDGTNATASNLAGNIAISPYASYMTTAQFESGKIDMTLLSPLTSQWQSEKRFRANNTVIWQNNGINAYLPEEDIITLVRWFDSMYAFSDNPLNEEGTIYGISFWLGEEGKDFEVNKEDGTYYILPHEGYESGSLWLNANSMSGALALYDTKDWMYVQASNTGMEIKGRDTLTKTLPYAVDFFDVNRLILTESESEVYSDTWTNLDTYISEWSAKFITGDKNLDSDWNEYIAGLETMGMSKLMAAYQSAYDRHITDVEAE